MVFQVIKQLIDVILLNVGLKPTLTFDEKLKVAQNTLRSPDFDYASAEWPKFNEIIEIMNGEDGQLMLKCGADVTVSQASRVLVRSYSVLII